MKKYLLLTFFMILFSTQFNAQSCLPAGITFSTQVQIDNFSANYPGCTEIEGQVIIEESSPGEILNLNGLSQLTSFGGNLSIRFNTNLGKLSGLDNVELVGGNLKIYSNPELDHLQNLSNLNFVEGDLLIKGNDDLNNLDGLHNLNSVDGDLIIENNDDLTKVDKLNSLQDLGSDNSLIIKNNSSLTKITNLGSLDLIEKDVIIIGNGLLTNLSGFGDVAFIGGDLKIEDNNSLTNLDGMDDLAVISGSLYIKSNNNLVNLDGLENLATIKDNLDISNNGALSNINALTSITIIPGYLFIEDNDALVNMIGLNNITSVGAELSIFSNELLINFTGLEKLSVVESFSVGDNPSLENFSGLNSLNSVDFHFSIKNNQVLENFSGMSNLISVEGEFYIKDNNALINFVGLNSFSTCNDNFLIVNNNSLIDFTGLNNLSYIDKEFYVEDNDALISMDGLEGLVEINNRLLILNNNNLNDINGIRNIDPNSITFPGGWLPDMEIKNNPNLSVCEIENICEFLNTPGKTGLFIGNSAGCNSDVEVMNACDGPDCTNLTDPVDGETDVDITTDLSWSSVVSAMGYKLTVGTTSGGTDILDHLDVGEVLTYDPGDFPCGSDIYVTITPYSFAADAIDCAEESFTTHGVNANAGTDKTICSSNSVALQANGGTTYSWSPTTGLSDPNISNPIASPSVTTIYTVEVSDDSGCSDTDDVTITVNPTPLPGASSTDETAYQANDGTATSNPSSGTPPFSFQWSNGQNTQTIVDLSPGNYTITVTDDKGCHSSQNTLVEEFVCPALTINNTQQNVFCFGQCDGEIEITGMTNGIAPFTYQWSTGDNTALIDNLCIGNYSVTVTDSKNCSESKSFTITQPTELFANASATDETSNDANDGTATANPTGGIAPYSYSWSNGDNTQTIVNLSPGNYTVTVTDGNNCTKEETVTVDEFICPALTIQSTQTNLSCFEECDGEIEITGMTNGVLPFTYQWSTGDNTALIDNLCIGNYSVTVTDAKNCSESKSFIITQPTELFSNASATAETANDANDGTATANPTGGIVPYNYSWSNGENTQTIDNLSPGNYTVTVTDNNGCTKEETVTVDEFICPALTLESTQTNTSCFGECDGEIEISNVENGVAPFTYSWSNGQTDQIATNLCAGDYTVTVTDNKNCSVVSEIFTITEPDELIVNASTTAETANDANDGTATANPTGGNDPYSYSWSNGENNQTIDNLSPGNYTVTVTDNNGCTKEETVTVDEFICPALTIQSEQLNPTCNGDCNGSIEVIGVTNGVEPFTYLWSTGGTNANILNLCAGTYSVTVTDADNCTATQSYEVTEPNVLLANATATNETENGAQDGTAIANPTGGTSPYEYAWSNGETSQNIVNLAPGNYTVTVTDDFNCTSIETVTVQEFICPTLTINASQTNVNCHNACNGAIEITSVTNAVQPLSYTWSNGETTALISNLCPGTYNVTITDDKNCQAEKSYTITEPTELLANASSTDETANDANDGTATTNPSGGITPYSFAWSNGQNTQSISGLAPGSYTVTVTDSNGCTSVESVSVAEFGCQGLAIIINQTNVKCNSECNGILEITGVTNGAAPFTYTWSNGKTTAKIDSLCPDNYSVTVVDGNNCNVFGTYVITEPAELFANATSTDETGNAANDGTASSNPSGGTQVYSYHWSNGQSTQSISGLTPGNYQLTVTDANGCTALDTVTVNEYNCPNLEVNSQTSNISCFDACDGFIAVLGVNNAASPLSYKWNTGASSASLSNLCAGDYSVTVTDAKNCEVVQTYSLTQPDEITITVDSTRDIRLDPLGYIAISTNNNGNYIFSWTGPGNFTAKTEDLDSLSDFGCYTLTVTDTVTNCSIDSTICLEDKTATFDLELNNIIVYPNPTNGDFIIDFANLNSSEAQISIFDLSGKRKLEISKSNKEKILRIDARDLYSGLYIIQIQFKGKKPIYKKIVIDY